MITSLSIVLSKFTAASLMRNWQLDMLPLALVIVLIFSVRFVKPIRSLDTDGYLSVESGKYYRGLFSIVVIFCHISLQVANGRFFPFFGSIGYLAVAYFFFLSGYGLQKSYIVKSDSYRKGFLLKRIPTILFPYIIITFAYWLMNFSFGKCYSFMDILYAIYIGFPIVSHSWYIIAILCFYIAFWLLMLLCRKHYNLMLAGAVVWLGIYTIFCLKLHFGGSWYFSTHLLIIGMFWAIWEEPILKWIRRAYFWVTPIILMAFFIMLFFREKIAARLSISLLINHPILLTWVTAVLFVLSVLLVAMKVTLKGRFLSFLGDISLELYVSHGLFTTFFRSKYIYINNHLLWVVAVLAATTVFSYFFHKLNVLIMKRYKGVLKKINI